MVNVGGIEELLLESILVSLSRGNDRVTLVFDCPRQSAEGNRRFGKLVLSGKVVVDRDPAGVRQFHDPGSDYRRTVDGRTVVVQDIFLRKVGNRVFIDIGFWPNFAALKVEADALQQEWIEARELQTAEGWDYLDSSSSEPIDLFDPFKDQVG